MVGPDQKQKLAGALRSILFPEEKYDDFEYVKKAKAIFEKMRNVNLRITPY